MNVLDELEGLIVDKFNTIKTLFSMTKLEVKLARLSVYPLIVNVCMILVVTMTSWIAAMGLLGYAVFQFYAHLWLAFTIILLLNLSAFYLLKRYLAYNLEKMSFQKTREYFGSIATLSEYNIHEQTQRSNDSPNGSGTALTESRT